MSDDEAGTSQQAAKTTKRERFSYEELCALGEGIEEHRDAIIDNKQSTNYERHEAWQAILTRVNAVSTIGRDIPTIKHRWQDVKVLVRRQLDLHKKKMQATGGSSAPRLRLQPWEQIASDTMQPDTIHGIGDMDVGTAPPGGGSSSTQPGRRRHRRPRTTGEGTSSMAVATAATAAAAPTSPAPVTTPATTGSPVRTCPATEEAGDSGPSLPPSLPPSPARDMPAPPELVGKGHPAPPLAAASPARDTQAPLATVADALQAVEDMGHQLVAIEGRQAAEGKRVLAEVQGQNAILQGIATSTATIATAATAMASTTANMAMGNLRMRKDIRTLTQAGRNVGEILATVGSASVRVTEAFMETLPGPRRARQDLMSDPYPLTSPQPSPTGSTPSGSTTPLEAITLFGASSSASPTTPATPVHPGTPMQAPPPPLPARRISPRLGVYGTHAVDTTPSPTAAPPSKRGRHK